jgi:hypothetical protein
MALNEVFKICYVIDIQIDEISGKLGVDLIIIKQTQKPHLRADLRGL